jgi:hypothetical protein
MVKDVELEIAVSTGLRSEDSTSFESVEIGAKTSEDE